MSENPSKKSDEMSDDDLVALLARRDTRKRAKSTTVLVAILLVLLGILIGVPLGRASAPTPAPVIPESAEAGAPRDSG